MIIQSELLSLKEEGREVECFGGISVPTREQRELMGAILVVKSSDSSFNICNKTIFVKFSVLGEGLLKRVNEEVCFEPGYRTRDLSLQGVEVNSGEGGVKFEILTNWKSD
ncbi:hypothetical protein NPIL_559321 [Nephila pilipes]|uniref:Uncharacterized protein n=1 Tax=Nephila pilipes TaxID=299642 RepID=A0A8X6I9I4_NEPPI|nr:hypothetical protein NPIL_559321 [Nephila pilipes]